METSTSSLQGKRPSLERLVTHFLASKRSLTSTDHVLRADAIVASARSSLEDIAVLDARSAFLAKSLGRQLLTLKAVRHGTETVSQDGRADFKALLRTLDATHARVKHTLHMLKTTAVEPSLRPPGEDPKCLHDFVDEQGVDELTGAFRECIDRTNEAQNEFGESNDDFDSQLRGIETALSDSAAPEDLRGFAHVTSLYRSLENHATEMADLLQSLVRHYDLCLTALKHTEGGGEAVRQADVDSPGGVNVDMLEREAPRQPVGAEELGEMLQVLDKDAAEVDDVVQEIRDRAVEMETQLDQILTHVDQQQSTHNALARATTLLVALGQRLAGYINASSVYLERWNEQKAVIASKMEELESVRDFYDRFLDAYDGLILEVGRRRTVESRMEKIVQEAVGMLDKLHQDDVEEREAFRKEHGEFLPSDIWPRLVDAPKKYEIAETPSAPDALPQLSKETIQKAIQRSEARRKPG